MLHQPERKEKNCLNCGTTVIGRYCHVCGQENVMTKESFWLLGKHFIFDIFHFDGKFFHTVAYLLSRPGFVAKEYCEGKRNRYLHPIRMYLFTSGVFFLVFFSFNKSSFINNSSGNTLDKEERAALIEKYQQRLQKDSSDLSAKKIIAVLKDTTTAITDGEILQMDTRPVVSVTNHQYSSIKEYDSIQKKLPVDKQDGWLARTLTKKAVAFNAEYKGRTGEGLKIYWQEFLHKLPYMLFLSLPFFALILQLLYVRRKNFYYSDHAIFTLYHYIISFILLLFLFLISQLKSNLGTVISWLTVITTVIWIGYLFVGMKNFYQQSWSKTFGKFLLLTLFGFIVNILLFILLLFFSIFLV